ncbi:MAG TPA: (Fe-S)-binding protein [Acidimicrobiales bacterium]|nr:(Fe-S)-binding protein [Acidimicrobiales bacterium]
MKLHVDEDELASCVACGLCLPHCPTYRVSGEETKSPRGRIAAMRSVHAGDSPADDTFVRYMDECVQCLGCQAACPSGVPFGRLMEGTRETLAAEQRYAPWWKRLAYAALGHHRLVLAGSTVLGVVQRTGLVPKRLSLPKLPLRRRPLVASGDDVWLFTGCVMDAWQRETHRAVQRVLEAAGAGVALPGAGGDCCGALHVHAGLSAQGHALGGRALASMPGTAPILVDSAGCGAALKDRDTMGRVLDVHEWLAARVDSLPRPGPGWVRPVVAVQDPCHLRHVQKAHLAVRVVLAPYADIVELDDEGLCCGAGGAYSVQQPDLAGAIRDRKVAAIERTGAALVVSANPGCAYHLAGAGIPARHPLEIVDEGINCGR